jgi:hypothetical protein
MKSSRDVNPYESPGALEQLAFAPSSAQRDKAQKRIRDTVWIMTIPALWNYGCLFWPEYVGLEPPAQLLEFPRHQIFPVVATANLVVLVAALVGLWFLALRILEYVALVIHRFFGGETSAEDWLGSMYHSLWTLAWASRLGAICFIAWLLLFFYAPGTDRFLVSVLFGAIGHLIGAWVYGTVLFNWYRLRRSVAQQAHD